MQMYKLTGKVHYYDARGNLAEWPFAYELQSSSNREEQEKHIITKWLGDNSPPLVSSGDIVSVEFKSVQLSDTEMAQRYGAVQRRLV